LGRSSLSAPVKGCRDVPGPQRITAVKPVEGWTAADGIVDVGRVVSGRWVGSLWLWL